MKENKEEGLRLYYCKEEDLQWFHDLIGCCCYHGDYWDKKLEKLSIEIKNIYIYNYIYILYIYIYI